ncbi:Subtilase family protein [Flexibacter flexilis DSM 6793]|uniref:Subtilase family protein n=1 Tax=Flexibacter flexilis DSM 6793 TaxID=927664 RepID=A0A1I1DFW1_9BACT|nr:S8 family serine peptidase [Flexibacter flexilis]SFB73276.1 Subtilase family protein [Flexibacter flexilis DSM 6793]
MEKNKKITLLFLALMANVAATLAAPRKFFVYFTDKNNSPYSILQPQNFLSERAIARRTNQNIAITTRDLPVNSSYVSQVQATGATVLYTSRWFNAAIVETDSSVLNTILQLPFVAKSERLTLRHSGKNLFPERNLTAIKTENYGLSQNQIQMLGADTMHALGYRGEGMQVAILDAGFLGINQHESFTHLFTNQQILGTYDFVARDSSVYEDHWHGAGVLSCMASYAPSKVIGTAFKAKYYLFRTENAATEYEIECANWAIAAEKADSLGVDVINSSLGYTSFDDASMNLTYNDLDGNKTIITRAADYAAATGMLVVSSAGNEGNNTAWGGFLSVPADGDSILTVGAVNSAGNYVSFSSRGPTADGRIKPDVVAQGSAVALVAAGTTNQYTTSSGTSFSSPLMAGLATSFWQANPTLNNYQVIEALRNSGTNHLTPNNQIGYGIPSFVRAHQLLSNTPPKLDNQNSLVIAPTLVGNQPLMLYVGTKHLGSEANITLLEDTGKIIDKMHIAAADFKNTLALKTQNLSKGIFMVRVEMGSTVQVFRLLKQ